MGNITHKTYHTKAYVFSREDTKFNCQECGKRLGLGRLFIKAIFTKKGGSYTVRCPACKFRNPIRKGEIGEELSKEFEAYD